MTDTADLLAWFNGTATGGPNADGRYPLINAGDGQTYLVYCPAAQALNPSFVDVSIENLEAAQASVLLAQQWANAAPDVQITPGQYSARHWAVAAAAEDDSGTVTYTGASLPPGTVPHHGERWLHSSGALLTYIVDADSGQWVEFGPAPYAVGNLPSAAVDGGTY